MLYFLLIACSILLGWANTADAATYWVAKTGSDSHSCAQAQSQSTPKLTIGSGLTCLGPGDTLMIKGGTYAEYNLNPPGGSSENNRVTIAGVPGETVIIRPPYQGDSGPDGIQVQLGRNYITVQDLIVDCRTCTNGLNIGGQHVRFQRVELAHVRGLTNCAYGNPPDCTSAGTGISVSTDPLGPNYLELIDFHMHHIGYGDLDGSGTVQGNPDCGLPFGKPNLGCHGIYMASGSNLVDRAEFDHIVGIGITISLSGGGPFDNNVIRNSKFHDIYNAAILLAHGSNSQIYNNLIYQSGVNPSEGILNSPSSTLIANNTVYGASGRGIGFDGGIIRNNIVYNNGQNLHDGSNGRAVVSNNLESNPSFVDAGAANFHIQAGSAAIDAGITVPQVTTDCDNRPRPQGSGFDIGAYEYTDSPPISLSAPTNLRITSR